MPMCGGDSSRNDVPTEYVCCVRWKNMQIVTLRTYVSFILLLHIVSVPTMTTGGLLTWTFKDERDSVPVVSSS